MSEPKSPAATEKELRDAFSKFDRDGSGTITSEGECIALYSV